MKAMVKNGSSQCSNRSPKISFSIIASKVLNIKKNSIIVAVEITGFPLLALASISVAFCNIFIWYWVRVVDVVVYGLGGVVHCWPPFAILVILITGWHIATAGYPSVV